MLYMRLSLKRMWKLQNECSGADSLDHPRFVHGTLLLHWWPDCFQDPIQAVGYHL